MSLIAPGTYDHSFAIGGSAAGSAFITDQAHLADGQPSVATRMRWIGGGQTAASFTRITVTLSNPAGGTPVVGAIGVFGVTGLPLGLQMVFNGDTAHPVLLVENPSGGLMAVYVPATAITSSTITIDYYNKVGVTSPVAPSALFETSEILCALRWTPPFGIKRSWSNKPNDPSMVRRPSGQPRKLMMLPKRTLKVTINNLPWVYTYGAPPDGSMNLQKLGFVLAKTDRCIVIPRWKTSAGAVDQAAIDALAMFCTLQDNGLGEIGSVNGLRFNQDLQFEEWPHG